MKAHRVTRYTEQGYPLAPSNFGNYTYPCGCNHYVALCGSYRWWRNPSCTHVR